MKNPRRNEKRDKTKDHPPQALQILFPTSSLLHNGVVLVPQLAQQRAPTAALTFLFAALAVAPTLASLSAPAAALGLAAASIFGDAAPSFAPPFVAEASPPVAEDVAAAAEAAAMAALASAAAVSSSRRAERASTLLYVGQPEHALVPPVPSHRPSPGHVPPVLVRWDFVAEVDDDAPVGIFGILDGEEVDLPFGVVAGAVVELLKELGTKGDGPTVLIALGVDVVDDWLEEALFAEDGGGVRPSEEGRGMCLDF